MLFRIILTVLFLTNLVIYVWLTVTAPSKFGPEIMTELLEQPLDGLQDAEMRLEMLDGLPERLQTSNSKLYWITHLILINAIVFIFLIAYISLVNNHPIDNSETADLDTTSNAG